MKDRDGHIFSDSIPCTCYFTLSTSLSQLAICLSNCLSDCLHSHHVIASDLSVATLSGWTNYNSNGKVILIWWIGGYTILHPPSQPAPANALPQGMAEPVDIHPVVFETLDAAKIRSAALRTSGAAGPSGLDAKEWRRLCTSFKHASKDLCHSLALMARRLSTTYVDPRGLYGSREVQFNHPQANKLWRKSPQVSAKLREVSASLRKAPQGSAKSPQSSARLREVSARLRKYPHVSASFRLAK